MSEENKQLPIPFDTSKKPMVPKWYLLPIEWLGSFFLLLPYGGIKIEKKGFDTLKAPMLILSNHAAEIDFPIAMTALAPHKTNWVISIEEYVGREWLLRAAGGIYKRKFTSDLTVVRHILQVLKQRKQNCTMYPEARYSLAGINERIDGSIGKLVKTAKCGVAVLIEHGNYISSPQWQKKPIRHVPLRAELTQIASAEEAEKMTAEEIQKKIEDAFAYDDYAYQYENKIKIATPNRAENLHRILYLCPECGKEETDSKGSELFCRHCGAKWQMDEYGKLHRVNGADRFTHIPDWYRFEREEVRKEVREGRYHFEDEARLEHLDNCKVGFRTLGKVKLTHGYQGFEMSGTLEDGSEFSFRRSVVSMYSCHIEYDFKGRGDAVDLCTLSDTYFVFPQTARNALTKLHFATEELYDFEKEKAKTSSQS